MSEQIGQLEKHLNVICNCAICCESAFSLPTEKGNKFGTLKLARPALISRKGISHKHIKALSRKNGCRANIPRLSLVLLVAF